ncbi:MAG: DNA-processing protein DprA [Anaerovoracaceae bacterium]|jgi:DNA processing protein
MAEKEKTGAGLLGLLYLQALPGTGDTSIMKRILPALCGSAADRSAAEAAAAAAGFENSDSAWRTAEERYLEIRKMVQSGELTVLTCFDGLYPEKLGRFRDLAAAGMKTPYCPPPVIYCRGNLALLETPSAAVIGTRKPSAGSLDFDRRLAKELVRNGRTVISGLAAGCDTAAHMAALGSTDGRRGRGRTIAVLPCGFDNIYPKSGAPLAERIAGSGAGLLISAYRPDESVERFRLIERDELTAALSDVVIAVQCGRKSGTMHTVKAAAAMKRPLACWWWDESEETPDGDFLGNYHMIAHMGAFPVKDEDSLQKFLNQAEKR